MRFLLICSLLLAGFFAKAQRACHAAEYSEAVRMADATAAQRMETAAAFQQQYAQQFATSAKIMEAPAFAAPVIHIPVVVHILYNHPTENISTEQVLSQIEALNRDFRRRNYDSANTPAQFRGLAADVAIEFELATTDPSGAPTTGIVRRYSPVVEWTSDDRIKFSTHGGDNAWDSKSYLNIWVGNLRRLVGYSSIPGGPEAIDGIVISTNSFGTINTFAPYNLGRTAVHEAGHWLGLKHIWGDTFCGEDGIADTPKQGNYTAGCPSGFRSSCSNGRLGDMYMNFMDFTSDACINLFTHGQKDRMRAAMAIGGPREALTRSAGLSLPRDPALKDKDLPQVLLVKASFRSFPNPANEKITLQSDDTSNWIGNTLSVYNVSGMLVQKVTIRYKSQELAVSQLAPGLYSIVGVINGARVSTSFIKR